MSKFKEGDKVKIYNWNQTSVTQVRRVLRDGILEVKDEAGGITFAHPKQCRKLVKKPRSRVWVGSLVWAPNENRRFECMEARFEKPDVTTARGEEWREFVEVRKKK